MEADEYYSSNYSEICCTGAVGIVSRVIHHSIETIGLRYFSRRFNQRIDLLKVLEVGAGGGQHSKYVRHKYAEMVQCDLRPENIPGTSTNPRIQKDERIIDAQYLPYADSSFDRVIATCLLAHLMDPEKALEEWKRVVRKGGVVSIYVPCEPGLILRISQAMTTRRKQKKVSVNAKLFHYREHRNHYPAMMTLIDHVFEEDVRVTNYPFPFLGWNFNLWSVIQVESCSKN
jgi:phosphatidylethanolamine/phosphatidyl-N-methylethanolamine N-methyltransferase